MSRSKSGLFARIRQAIHGRKKSKQASHRRQFLRLEPLELRTVMAVAVGDGPYSVDEDQVLSVDAASGVLANDTAENGALTASLVETTANGLLELEADGSFVYTPDEHFFGTDTFTYQAIDDDGASEIVTVTIDVTAVNDAPVAVDDAYLVQEDGELVVSIASGVLANDEDVDDDVSTLVVTKLTDPDPSEGEVTLNPDGSFTFTPADGFTGSTTFTYSVSDGDATSNPATVTITVNARPTVSDVPDQVTTDGTALENLPFTVADDETAAGALNITVTSSDQTLIPDDNLTLGGSDENRTLSIAPVASQTGTATITITVTDANGGSVTETFVVTVNGDTDPTIDDISDQVTTEDVPLVDIPFTIGDAETDLDSLTLTVSSDNQDLIPDGNIALGGSGANRTITVTPALNQSGTATITVTVTDGAGNTTEDTFLVTVTADNDAPTISDIQDQTTPFNTPIVELPFQIGDIDNDVATFVPTATSDNQTLIPDANIVVEGTGADRTITITPVLGQSGTAVITVTVSDGAGGTISDTFEVTVSANTPPTIEDVTDKSMVQDGELIVTVGIDDAETADDSLVVTAVSDNLALIPNENIVVSTTGGTRTITITPAAGQTGTAIITLTVDDGFGGTATDTFQVTVTANTPPTIDPVDDQTTDEDVAITGLEVAVGDAETPDADLELTASSDNQDLIPDGAIEITGDGPTRTITITPAAHQFGTATITLTLTDGDGVETTQTFLVTVDSVNDQPTIEDVGDQTIPQDGSITNLEVDISDIETAADDLVVTAVSDNTTLIPNENIVISETGGTRTITITPAPGQTGTATITLTADDGNGGTAEDTFTVTVTANTPPTIGPVDDQTTNEDIPLTGIEVAVGDAETPDAELELTASSDNQSLIPDSAIEITGDGPTRTISITPAANQSGTATITLTLTDGDGVETTQTFVVTVNALNDAPTIENIGDQTVVQDGSITGIEFDISDPETAVDDLVVTGTSDNTTLIPNENIVISETGGTRTITITPAAGQTGTATITLTVDDGNGGTVQDTFVVTVVANTLPTITPVEDQTTAEDTALSGIEVTVGDTETPAADLTLTAVSDNQSLIPDGNINIAVNGATRTITITPVADQSGTATITLTVTDGNGGSTTETFVVMVTPQNDLPTIDPISDQSVAENGAITDLPVNIGDVETDAGDLELTGTSSNTTLIPNSAIVFGGSGASRTVTITPAAGQVGTATITINVEDADGGTTVETFVVTVTGDNTPPTITPIADQTTDEDTPLTGIDFTVGDDDTDPADIEVTAVSSNTGLIPNGAITITGEGADRTITITPAANQSGTATITLTVDDGEGGTVTEIFVVTVNAVNDLPTISPVADVTTNEDTATGSITVTFSDQETAAGDLQFSVTSSNTDLVPNANIAVTGSGGSRNLVITPAANQSGATTITITVTDANGGTTTETFVVTVNSVNDAPTAVNDTYTTTEETVLVIDNVAQGVLANDTDPENQTLTTVLVLAPSSGQLVLNTNGTFTYTPATNFSGQVTFQYRARDASGAESGIATVTINVTNVNDAPTATADSYSTNIGGTLTVNAANGVLANDADPDTGTTLVAQLVNGPSNGTLNLAADGSFTYTPNAGFSGTDTFTYRASDGSLQSSPVTVTINVSAVINGEPIIVGPTAGVRGQTLTYQLSIVGGTSDNVTYNIDWNGDGTNDQTITGAGSGVAVTHVFGTSGNYNIRVQVGSPVQSTNLAVSITDTMRVGSTFVVGGTTGNDSIVVQKVGKAGIRVLVNGTIVGGVQTGVNMVEVSGGAGNDNIVMAGNVNAIAVFRGGAGNDRLVGGKLGDFLFGDEGNDILNGLGASDFLSGGAGDDVLNGGHGHDVLFGGDGVDSLVGGSHYNLMIGGTTDFDNDFKTQKAILHAWAAGGTFQMRMNRLNFMSKGGLKLVQNDTVNTDGDADRIVSTGSRDWIFAAIADADRVIGKQRGRIVT